jgi:hypothetical protein
MKNSLPFPVLTPEEAKAKGFRPLFEPVSEQKKISDGPLLPLDGEVKVKFSSELQSIKLDVDIPNQEIDKTIVTRMVSEMDGSTLDVSMSETIYPEWDWKAEEIKNAKNGKKLFWFFLILVGICVVLAIFNK